MKHLIYRHEARSIAALFLLVWSFPLLAEDLPAGPEFPTIATEAPVGTIITQPCLEPLESVRCGRFRVWEDRAAQSGRTLDLAFIVAKALQPGGSGDAITFFNGGPGSSVTAFAAQVLGGSDAFRQQRDLLLFDFRGVGASGSLDCNVPYPSGFASRFGTVFPVDHIRACRDQLSQRAQLDLYTSNHTMDDLEDLRRLLNYTALNLVGGSYGTREIQVFLRRHPTSVRSAILKGVSPLFTPGYVTHARGLQRALDELVTECASLPDCNTAYPDLEQTIATVLERIHSEPPMVEIDGHEVRFGAGDLGYALRGLLYGQAAHVPAFLSAAKNGDWQPLAEYYVQRTGWVASPDGQAGMHFSVLCAEDMARVTETQVDELSRDTFLGDHLIRGYLDVCREWPHAQLPDSFWEPVTSSVPALLLSGSRDPVTPPAGGDAVANHLSNSRHLVIPGKGHALFGPCFDEIETQFIETASVEGLDISCFEERPPTDFVLPEKEGSSNG